VKREAEAGERGVEPSPAGALRCSRAGASNLSRDPAPTGRWASHRARRFGGDSGGVAAMVTIKKAPGRAQFEVSIDGMPRSYRDRKAIAIEAA
jgi:hypothetical protein